MQVSPPSKDGGETHYKVVEVLEFTPAEQQMQMPLKNRRAGKRAGGAI